eukprot:m.60232 g.60232  ORF g.60232 m.60232 type:complete len:605 (+) comp7262_c0_seq1:130-1944(+)
MIMHIYNVAVDNTQPRVGSSSSLGVIEGAIGGMCAHALLVLGDLILERLKLALMLDTDRREFLLVFRRERSDICANRFNHRLHDGNDATKLVGEPVDDGRAACGHWVCAVLDDVLFGEVPVELAELTNLVGNLEIAKQRSGVLEAILAKVELAAGLEDMREPLVVGVGAVRAKVAQRISELVVGKLELQQVVECGDDRVVGTAFAAVGMATRIVTDAEVANAIGKHGLALDAKNKGAKVLVFLRLGLSPHGGEDAMNRLHGGGDACEVHVDFGTVADLHRAERALDVLDKLVAVSDHGNMDKDKAFFRGTALKRADQLKVGHGDGTVGVDALPVVEGVRLSVLHKRAVGHEARDMPERLRNGCWKCIASEAVGAILSPLEITGLKQVGRCEKRVVAKECREELWISIASKVVGGQFGELAIECRAKLTRCKEARCAILLDDRQLLEKFLSRSIHAGERRDWVVLGQKAAIRRDLKHTGCKGLFLDCRRFAVQFGSGTRGRRCLERPPKTSCSRNRSEKKLVMPCSGDGSIAGRMHQHANTKDGGHFDLWRKKIEQKSICDTDAHWQSGLTAGSKAQGKEDGAVIGLCWRNVATNAGGELKRGRG